MERNENVMSTIRNCVIDLVQAKQEINDTDFSDIHDVRIEGNKVTLVMLDGSIIKLNLWEDTY